VNRLVTIGLFLASVPAFAQLDPHTLTISANRQINLQPDQVVFGLSVSSSVGTNLGQIVAAVAGLGITSANLTGVNNDLAPQLQWTFTLAVPLSSLTATIGSLTNLQQTIAQNNSGLALTFEVNGTQVSAQLQQSQSCSTSDLIGDATAQAQKLATAAGMTLGPILTLSSAGLIQPAAIQPASLVFFNPNATSVSDFLLGATSPPVTCSLVVEFQLQP
jgi:uncharacterized protein YggE